MQKKLIALAIAGLASSAAFADSANVTMYGVADGSFEAVSAGGATPNSASSNTAVDFASRSRVNTNNSLIGFKGAESLGNGLTAVFQFETNVNLGGNAGYNPAGTSALLGSQRDTYIGLAGAFGTVAAGYLSTPTRSTLVQFDVMPGATGAAGINTLIGRVNAGAMLNPMTAGSGLNTGNNFGTAGYNQNTVFRTDAIAYISPTMGGLTGVLAYVPTVRKDNANGTTGGTLAAVNATHPTRTPNAWNLSLNYANGPVKVGYAYLRANDTNVLTTLGVTPATSGAGSLYSGSETNTTHILGASYDFGNGLMISGVYDRVNVDLGVTASGAGTATLARTLSRTAWYLGAKYATGPHEFAGNYASMGNNSIGCVGTCSGTANYGDSGAKQFSLRYGYNLSKRTQVYGLYTRVTNDANGNFDVFNGSGAAAASTLAGADPQVWGAGMRHNF